MADREGVEPSRDWLLRTVFKTVATTYWLAYPLILVRKEGIEPPSKSLVSFMTFSAIS